MIGFGDPIKLLVKQSDKEASNKSRRADSKQAQVLAMLRSKHGATIASVMEVTGWQLHSVRGFLAGIVRKKLGLTLMSEKPGEERVACAAGVWWSILRAPL
jgi:Protein of unknown function (DUF3489)